MRACVHASIVLFFMLFKLFIVVVAALVPLVALLESHVRVASVPEPFPSPSRFLSESLPRLGRREGRPQRAPGALLIINGLVDTERGPVRVCARARRRRTMKRDGHEKRLNEKQWTREAMESERGRLKAREERRRTMKRDGHEKRSWAGP